MVAGSDDPLATGMATPKRPRGDKRSIAEVEANVERVERMMRSGTPRYTILRLMHGLGLSERSIDRCMERVRERWVLERMQRQETAVEERLAHMRYLAKKARDEGNWAACRGFEREINLILGVYAPEKHAIQAAVAVAPMQAQAAPAVNYADMSDVILDALEQALRAAQKAGGAVLALPASENASQGPAASPGSER